MPVVVALLRGINVGGRSTLAMAELRAIVEGCGYDDVRTYIQSGNVVLRTTERSTAKVADRLRAAIAEQSSVRPDVVVRTATQLAAVVDRNPFLARGEDPARLHVVFMGGDTEASVGGLDVDAYAPEEAAAVGQELYLFLPGGMGRSKLAVELGKAKHGGSAAGTARNWRTVTTLAELAAGA